MVKKSIMHSLFTYVTSGTENAFLVLKNHQSNIINNYNKSLNDILDLDFFPSSLPTPNVFHIPSTSFWSNTHPEQIIHLLNDPDSTDSDTVRKTSVFNENVHF